MNARVIHAAVHRSLSAVRSVAALLVGAAVLLLLVALVSDIRQSIAMPVTVLVSGLLGWLAGRPAAGQSTMRSGAAKPVAALSNVGWTRYPQNPARAQLLKTALEDLADLEALSRSPLTLLPVLSGSEAAGSDLRDLLVDVIVELAASRMPRDAEAGRLMLDYYVKQVGSHELIMERLCLSRPTFYRRLQRGLALMAERVDDLSEFAVRSQRVVA
jgi:hypothetical protein